MMGRRQPAVAQGCGLVQVIRLGGSKSARGGQSARDRNAVPLAFVVPTAELADADGQLCVGLNHWGARNCFAEPFSTRQARVGLRDGFTFGCVNVLLHAEGLQVQFRYNQADGGAPDRSFVNGSTEFGERPGQSLTVRVGEWVRVCYNGRFSCIDSGNWWYEQVTVNVAWFGSDPDGRVFVDREPTAELRGLSSLW